MAGGATSPSRRVASRRRASRRVEPPRISPGSYSHAVQQMNRRGSPTRRSRSKSGSRTPPKAAPAVAEAAETAAAAPAEPPPVVGGLAHDLACIERRSGDSAPDDSPSPPGKLSDAELGAELKKGEPRGGGGASRRLWMQGSATVALNSRQSFEHRLSEKRKHEQRRAELLALNRILARRDEQQFNMCMVVVGGSNVYGQSQTVWQFHPQVGVWRQLCSLLQPRCNGASCATPKGDLISAGGYVTGGTFVSSVEIYESRKRASRLLPPMPHGVYGGRACCLGDKLLVVGGQSCEGIKALDTLLIYSFSTGEWRQGPAMRDARRFPAVCVLPEAQGGGVVVSGGQSASGQPLRSVERYLPKEDRWASLPDMPAGRYAHASCLLPDGRVGVFASHTRSRSCEALNIAAGTWTALPPMTHGRAHACAATVGGRVVVVGGTKESGPGDEMLSWDGGGTGAWSRLEVRAQDQEGRGVPGIKTPLRECGGLALPHFIG